MKQKQIVRVLTSIEQGCRTSREIADATKLPRPNVSAYLSELKRLRLIRAVGKIKFNISGRLFIEWVKA